MKSRLNHLSVLPVAGLLLIAMTACDTTDVTPPELNLPSMKPDSPVQPSQAPSLVLLKETPGLK